MFYYDLIVDYSEKNEQTEGLSIFIPGVGDEEWPILTKVFIARGHAVTILPPGEFEKRLNKEAQK